MFTKLIKPENLRKFSFKRPLVFTNGCFDVVHRGHVCLLREAKSLGASLILALNSDESVKTLKGPARPLNKLEDRLFVLSEFESIDYLTWFGEDTPLKLIEIIKPDVLVKGGDWTIDKIVGGSFVESIGGKVFSLPFEVGYSTSNIINRARTFSKGGQDVPEPNNS